MIVRTCGASRKKIPQKILVEQSRRQKTAWEVTTKIAQFENDL
jgi:hypothetical protein